MIFRLLCVGLPALAALIVATVRHSPRHLKLYFAAQLVNVLIGLGYGHVSSDGWRLLYFVGTVFIIAAMVQILIESGFDSLPLCLTSFLVAAVTTAIIWVNMTDFAAGHRIVLGEGATLTFAACALGFWSMRLGRKPVYVTLVILWLALAFFDFAYALDRPLTYSLQFWLPAALIGIAMIVIAACLGREEEVPQ